MVMSPDLRTPQYHQILCPFKCYICQYKFLIKSPVSSPPSCFCSPVNNLKEGDIIWSKYQSFPHWPALVRKNIIADLYECIRMCSNGVNPLPHDTLFNFNPVSGALCSFNPVGGTLCSFSRWYIHFVKCSLTSLQVVCTECVLTLCR